jgi:hypothetical protein
MRRLLHSIGFPDGGPLPIGKLVHVAVTMPRLDPSVAASPVTTPGRSGVADDAIVVLRATAEKKVVDAVAVKKATDDATAVERATANKKAMDVAAAMKGADDVVATERTTMDVAAHTAAEPKASGMFAEESNGSNSSPTLVVGAKRAAVPSGSTPPTKRPFRGS